MSARTPPCKDCTKRELGCHVTCAEYIAYKERRNRELKAKHLENITNDYTTIEVLRSRDKRRN